MLRDHFHFISDPPDHIGREYVIAFMDNFELSPVIQILECFITIATTAVIPVVNVEITSPAWILSGPLNIQITLTPGVVEQVLIPKKFRLVGSQIEGKGILIQSDDNIVVFGVNKQYRSTDGFVSIPTDSLGTEYYTVAYYRPYRISEFAICGVEDSTTVSIMLASCANCRGLQFQSVSYSAGQTISVQLDRCQCVQIQIPNRRDHTGTHIMSDKPVSVFSGNKKTNIGSGGSQDHIVEQMTPVKTWGKRFVTVPIPARTTGDYFYFIASEDSTTITFDCTAQSGTITLSSAGDFARRTFTSSDFCYVESDKAVLLVQMVLSQLQNSNELADPSMILIVPIEQYAADYTYTTPTSASDPYINYFMFVVESSKVSGLRLDGGSIPGTAVTNNIPGTNLIGGYFTVTPGQHRVYHVSPIVVFEGLLFGKGNLESYGYPAGFRLAPINEVCLCYQDTTKLLCFFNFVL